MISAGFSQVLSDYHNQESIVYVFKCKKLLKTHTFFVIFFMANMWAVNETLQLKASKVKSFEICELQKPDYWSTLFYIYDTFEDAYLYHCNPF